MGLIRVLVLVRLPRDPVTTKYESYSEGQKAAGYYTYQTKMYGAERPR